jgi:lipoprotein-releasing system ATP-binding protein
MKVSYEVHRLEYVMLEVTEITKDYPSPRGPLPVLNGASLSLSLGDAASIMGPSGCGKSTLLYILGALEPPTSGTVTLGGRNPYQLAEKDLAAFRNEAIGFVFQEHHLLPQLTAIENALAPTLVAPAGGDYEQRARRLLSKVGLSERDEHRPAELSGGEKQRVAVARALMREPTLLLCDEPTGNLDRNAAEAVVSLLLELDEPENRIVVVVTHNAELAARFPIRLELTDGKLQAIQ